MVELFVPLGGMAMIAVMLALVTRLIATGLHHGTMRRAMRDNPESMPALIARLEDRLPWADGLLGWIFIAFALALLVLGVTDPDPEESFELTRAAIVPAMIGVFVLGYVWLVRKTPRP